MLHGIIEADETYVGGKPRKGNNRDDDTPNPRGRATKKMPVIGVVERGGNVKARVATDLTGKGILRFIRDTIDPHGSLLITDEYKATTLLNPTCLTLSSTTAFPTLMVKPTPIQSRGFGAS